MNPLHAALSLALALPVAGTESQLWGKTSKNLFTDLDLGEGSRMWKCGGGADLGRHCGARGTFWNIRAKRPQKHPGTFGPDSMNLVGLETREKATTEPGGRWFEAIPPADLRPQNLHQAQWERRMGVMK